MKKHLFYLTFVFLSFTLLIYFCPIITQWDKSVIIAVQNSLHFIPQWIPILFDSQLYSIFIAIPLIFSIIYFYKKYLYLDVFIIASVPIFTYLFNLIFKQIIQRPRPAYELQMVQHDNFSYVSSHTLITFCLWGIIIYYIYTYCKNKILKITGIVFSILWIILLGFSRIWLGVHNPTDVVGAYLLGSVLLILYIKLIKILGGKFSS